MRFLKIFPTENCGAGRVRVAGRGPLQPCRNGAVARRGAQEEDDPPDCQTSVTLTRGFVSPWEIISPLTRAKHSAQMPCVTRDAKGFPPMRRGLGWCQAQMRLKRNQYEAAAASAMAWKMNHVIGLKRSEGRTRGPFCVVRFACYVLASLSLGCS